MLKLLPIAALFAGAQAQDVADPISGLTCNLVNRNDGRNLNDVSSTSPYKMGWAFSFATSADGEQGALDTYINPDGWKLDSNCTIRTADDMGLIERRDYCKKVCWLGGAFSRNEANLNKWEDALNNLESSNDCRTETCLNSMMDSVKTFVAGSDELTQGSTTRQVYEARSDGRPQKIIVKYDTRRRLSDLHRRLSEDEPPAFTNITGMFEIASSAPYAVAAMVRADSAATNNAYLNSIQYSSGTLSFGGMTWECSGGSNQCAPTARRLSEDATEYTGSASGSQLQPVQSDASLIVWNQVSGNVDYDTYLAGRTMRCGPTKTNGYWCYCSFMCSGC